MFFASRWERERAPPRCEFSTSISLSLESEEEGEWAEAAEKGEAKAEEVDRTRGVGAEAGGAEEEEEDELLCTGRGERLGGVVQNIVEGEGEGVLPFWAR